MSATELSETLKLPLTTVEYNINALLEAELIIVDRIKFSRKRRDIKYYAPVKRALIFAPEKTEKGVISFLKRALPILIVLVLSIPVGFVVQRIVLLPHEIPIENTYIPLYAFMTGVIFAIMIFILVEFFLWLIKNIREEKA